MKGMDTIIRVWRAFYVQGWSMKRIALELHLSRNTVRKILGTDVSTNLQRKPRPKPGIGLPQLHPSLLLQRYQLIPRPLGKTAIRRIGDGLFHHGRIDGYALCAALVDGTGVPPSLDRLVQHPLHTLPTDALASPTQ